MTHSKPKTSPLLSIKSIYGASVVSSSSFCISLKKCSTSSQSIIQENDCMKADGPNAYANLVCYTASGGVVVCDVSLHDLVVQSQRFFCANFQSHSLLSNISASSSSSNSSLKTDKFGFPILTDPLEINSTSNNGAGNSRIDEIMNSNSHTLNMSSINNNSGVITDSGLGQLSNSTPNNSGALHTLLRIKVRTISCVSISSDQKLLAVGETGYQPRILLYSLASDASGRPLASISEHTFGINSITFSPKGKYLASLGVSNDGYLNVWKINNGANFGVTLIGSNKCTSIVNNMIWLNDTIFTFGLRHLKAWKLDLNSSLINLKTLNVIRGKNVVLAELLSENFTELKLVRNQKSGESKILVLTESGILCSIELEALNITPLMKFKNKISTFYVDDIQDLLWYEELKINEGNTSSNCLKSVKLSELFEMKFSLDHDDFTGNSLVAILSNNGKKITKPSSEVLSIVKAGDDKLFYVSQDEINIYCQSSKTSTNLIEPVFKYISGVKKISSANSLLLWSENGDLAQIGYPGSTENNKGIDPNKLQIHSKQKFNLVDSMNDSIDNKLTSICITRENELVVGDRLGFFLVKNLKSNKYSYYVKAHESSINDIIELTVGDFIFIVTASRDRTLQVFYKKKYSSDKENNNNSNQTADSIEISHDSQKWDLLQTLTIHKANIIQVLNHGNKLLVCSADRSLSVHSIEIDDDDDEPYVTCDKILGIKGTPIKMNIVSSNSLKNAQELVISTNDKQLLVYNLPNLELKRSLKLYCGLNKSLLVDNFAVMKDVDLIACSCSDKSIRVFNYSTGKLITTDWPHSGLIVGLEVYDNKLRADGVTDSSEITKNIISLSNDGCIFIWELKFPKDYDTDSIHGDSMLSLVDFEGDHKKATKKKSLMVIPKVQRKIVKSKSVSNMRHNSSSVNDSLTLKSRSINIDRRTKSGAINLNSLKANVNNASGSLFLKPKVSLPSSRLVSNDPPRTNKQTTTFSKASYSKRETSIGQKPKVSSNYASRSTTMKRATVKGVSQSTISSDKSEDDSNSIEDLLSSLGTFREKLKNGAFVSNNFENLKLLRQELDLTQKDLDAKGEFEEKFSDSLPIKHEFMRSLLENYSDELVNMVKRKL